ncbi:TetR/AcrR family transcriptional regulator [Rhodoferax sp.]|uniref:TetR/AcrR family transcriptional regulator n=1 Tax=Rhodoferax sp. TaxID=50421 RepID=UPI001ED5AB6A|nr:TetR/AcrR family transcriptional regulator [Rhodoferax sp.]MBT9505257.1 TetR/AcrR family transcriptional regulator [Rhodoferax sp.]
MSISELPVKSSGPGARQGPRGARASQKGQQTKQAIVDAALGLASQIGLEGLSIGALAEVTQMSKSGVFAHFGSREELQISVVREYYARFADEVFFPAMEEERGLPRVKALFDNWMKRVAVELQSGCIFISGAVEYDDRPGPVRDALVSSVKSWLAAVFRAVVQAKECGHLSDDSDEDQMAFEIHGLILALHYEARFLKNPNSISHANKGFENILARYGKFVRTPSPLSVKSISSSKE